MSDRSHNPQRKIAPTVPREQFDAVVAERDALRSQVEEVRDWAREGATAEALDVELEGAGTEAKNLVQEALEMTADRLSLILSPESEGGERS